MWRRYTSFPAALIALAFALPSAADIDRSPQVVELVRMHDLSTSVSIGNYYLKQEALLATRSLLSDLGRQQDLGDEWNPRNPYWRQAEAALLERAAARIDRDFGSLTWFQPQWADVSRSEFSDSELQALLAHFGSEVGRKQMQIVNHTVSTHVMMTLSFSGKLKDVPGIEEERAEMQSLWNAEDRAMRFSLHDVANAEGQRFALSPLGKKYFVAAVLKLTGLVSRRIDELAASMPLELGADLGRVQPYLEAFRGGRG
ncbi:MAG: hypothetical protein WDZ63_02005 [Burkholderiales bacterium]